MTLHIQLNPFKLYKGRVALDRGLLVEMLRMCRFIWKSYHDVLEYNGKVKSEEKELDKLLKAHQKAMHGKKKAPKRNPRSLLDDIRRDFKKSTHDLKKLDANFNTLIQDDETLLFRKAKELEKLFRQIMNSALPDHNRLHSMIHIHSLVEHMSHKQHHTWIIAKGQARGHFKFAEVTPVGDRLEQKRIRRQTIEIGHIEDRLPEIKKKVKHLLDAQSSADITLEQESFAQEMDLYHQEYIDIGHIIHEVQVLMKRSENMFHHLKVEVEHMNDPKIKRQLNSFEKKFNRILSKLQEQSLREYIDIRGIEKWMNGELIREQARQKAKRHHTHHAK